MNVEQLVTYVVSNVMTIPDSAKRAKALDYILKRLSPGMSEQVQTELAQLARKGLSFQESLVIALTNAFQALVTQLSIKTEPLSGLGSVASGVQMASSMITSLTGSAMNIYSTVSGARQEQAAAEHQRRMQRLEVQSQQRRAELDAELMRSRAAAAAAQPVSMAPMPSLMPGGGMMGGGVPTWALVAGGGAVLLIAAVLLLKK